MATKITTAMRKRLEQVQRGDLERTGYGWSHSYHTTGTATGGLTYVMVDKMEEAGLIAWKDTGQLRNRHIAVLTEAGVTALVPNAEITGRTLAQNEADGA